MWGQGPPLYPSWGPCTPPGRQGPPPRAAHGRQNKHPRNAGTLWIHGVENEGSTPGNAAGTVPGLGSPPGPSHLSAPWLSSRLAPERLSLPDLLPESEARLLSLPCEDSRELCPLSASSQPPPGSPGWWLTAGTAGLSWARPQTPQTGGEPPESPGRTHLGPRAAREESGAARPGCWRGMELGRARRCPRGGPRGAAGAPPVPGARPGPRPRPLAGGCSAEPLLWKLRGVGMLGESRDHPNTESQAGKRG